MIDYSLAAGICNLFVIGTTKLIGFHSPFLCALFKQKAKVTVKHINLLNSCHYGQWKMIMIIWCGVCVLCVPENYIQLREL